MPCGLRVQHLREAGPPGAANNLHEHLAGLVNLLAQGQACPEIAPVLAGAGLVALPKPHGGVRPIAVGEVLRRLTGKCLMTLARDEARSFFWPVQLGVAVPAGVESCRAHSTGLVWPQCHLLRQASAQVRFFERV